MPADGKMVLARRLAGLLEKVRQLPGLGGFQRPVPAADLRRAAALGPVVTVNVTQRRTDALIVTPDAVLPLPLDFTARDLHETAYAYVEAIERHQSRLAALEEADAAAQEIFNVRTCAAYQHAAVALVEADAMMESLLTLLPLHAAGRHGEAGQSSLDRAVMSYTPSLRVLIESRLWERSTVAGGMLHVALPKTPGQRDLPHVEREENC
ncbi:hypothetical protein ACF1BE_34080 [Streptomyces sp. NPDC014991]|uniref:hypothetical protein n=1 Tax=Streptomyces sp. NPDC014991 TaxID=3364935 RepID=UPI0036FE61F7